MLRVIVLAICVPWLVLSSTFVNLTARTADEEPIDVPFSVDPPAPPPTGLPPAPPTDLSTEPSTHPPRSTTTKKPYSVKSIYSHFNSTEIFGKKVREYSRRRGRQGFGGQGSARYRPGNKPTFHVYSITAPRPPPIPPLPPTMPTAPPIIITQTIQTTRGPPAPLIPGGPAPLIIGAPAPLIPGQPAPLLPVGAPAPLSSPQATPTNGALAQNIRCAMEGGQQRLTAIVNRPNGFTSHPVFNDALVSNSVTDQNCRMSAMSHSRSQYQIEVLNFKACGVRAQRQGADNKEWMALTVRFPFITGLRLAEDEYIMVLCRPQEKTRIQSHALDLRSNVARSSKSVFSSSPQAFQCDIGLFRVGTTGSAEKVTSGTSIEIGEKLQLVGEVRSGDGWNYARLTDVIVRRVGGSSAISAAVGATVSQSVAYGSTNNVFRAVHNNGRKKRSSTFSSPGSSNTDIAFLVLSDGCRNPTFTPIAPYHPWSDNKNRLAVNFLFKAFMFQNMRDGDSIRITARVMACVKQHDCQYKICTDDNKKSFGRKKRSIEDEDSVGHFNIDKDIFSNGTVKDHKDSNITNFDQDLDLIIVSPGHLRRELKQKQQEAMELQSKKSTDHGLYFICTIALSAALACTMLLIGYFLIKKKPKKSIDSGISKEGAEMQHQIAVVAAATAAATAAKSAAYNPNFVSSTPHAYYNSCDSDIEYQNQRTLRKCHSKSSIKSCRSTCSKGSRSRRNSRRCYSSDDTYSESDVDLKCSVV